MDYTKLEDLLVTQKWKEADKLTYHIMLTVAQRTQQRYLDDKSIKNFSCEDIHIIDRLWLTHSQFRFWFSVQKQVYNVVSMSGELPEHFVLSKNFF